MINASRYKSFKLNFFKAQLIIIPTQNASYLAQMLWDQGNFVIVTRRKVVGADELLDNRPATRNVA